MEKVTGIGGVFFKAKDPKGLTAWYRDRLGLPVTEHGIVVFRWREEGEAGRAAATAWSVMSQDTKHFEPSAKPFMFNYRVRDLDAMLAQLRQAGAEVDPKIDESEFGRFGWVMDPEGNRIELWQPPE